MVKLSWSVKRGNKTFIWQCHQDNARLYETTPHPTRIVGVKTFRDDTENMHKEKITVKIITKDQNSVNLRLKEALDIRNKKPKLNSREECNESVHQFNLSVTHYTQS